MLSYIYRITCEFQRTHHCRPNVLYLNKVQLLQLRHAFADPDDIDTMTRLLKMHIIISHDATHPHLARIEKRWGHSEQLPDIRSAEIAPDKKSYRNNENSG